MTDWSELLPDGLGKAGVKLFEAGTDPRRIAGVICERAWQAQGVRVFRWPLGAIAVVNVGSRADAQLLATCVDALLVTYARHTLFGDVLRGDGPSLADVLRDLTWARASA
ncbi:hypothetical protein PY254_10550 [Rhodanobacter sp. AS-Z3]|uniref:hypothetical protein n=1 Tax=Rhodanobacter sp. AS-Z3 TaxID=3031330 RepID=UPI00247A1974|nr:hypothetical protein [Rhodanobacter sp. AS-Z3]WEN13686.1 hypothetical protein PY254_10550 [Rhodanobacter sp. AS-Z3]